MVVQIAWWLPTKKLGFFVYEAEMSMEVEGSMMLVRDRLDGRQCVVAVRSNWMLSVRI